MVYYTALVCRFVSLVGGVLLLGLVGRLVAVSFCVYRFWGLMVVWWFSSLRL